MDIEIKHISGVGLNSKFAVVRDGVQVAEINRDGNKGVKVEGPYFRVLARFASIDAARARIKDVPLLSAQETYDVICGEVYMARKAALERHFGPLMARLSREWLNGSNHASEQLSDLLAAIEEVAADRDFSTADPQAAGTPKWRTEYCFGEEVPLGNLHYPRPPKNS